MKLVQSAVALTLILLITLAALAEIPANRARMIEAAAPAKPQASPRQPRRVLIFVTPPHLMDKDPHRGYCIPYGAYALETLGRKSRAFQPVVSDDLATFLPENIRQFDAIVLNNASGPWITPTGKQMELKAFRQHGETAEEVEKVIRESLLDFVRGGKGLAAIHYAIGANRHWPQFHEMLGAKYAGHPWNEEVGIKIDEPKHPVAASFSGRGFRLAEEIYQFQEPYSRRNVRVLLSLDTKKTNMDVKWLKRDDGDFALAWVRSFGKGRVFYTAIGHRTELYWNPAILRLYLNGIQFATGDLQAPAEPTERAAAEHRDAAGDSKEKSTLEKGFVRIFNGRDLEGWDGDRTIWSVRDGAITGQTTKDSRLKVNNFLIWKGGQPGDFELRLRYKLSGGNSGIYFHAEKQPDGEPLIGPQADFSADHRWTGVLMEWKKRNVLAERGQRVLIDESGNRKVTGSVGDPQKLLSAVHNDDWNDYTVIVRGPRVVLKINDTLMCEVTDNDPRRTPRGHLALQVHVGPPMKVQFKDIRMKQF